MEAKSLVTSQNQIGEGPTWSVDEQALYWVDIYGKLIERLDPETGQHRTFQLPCLVGAAVLRQREGLSSLPTRVLPFGMALQKKYNGSRIQSKGNRSIASTMARLTRAAVFGQGRCMMVLSSTRALLAVSTGSIRMDPFRSRKLAC